MKQITSRTPNVIDLMKVGFLFMVIFLHALDEETRFAGAVAVQELPAVLAWCRDVLTRQVLRCAVPGFFLLSGALLFRREFSWKANLARKFRRLLVPYLLLNTFWLAVCLAGRRIGALSAYFSSEATNVYGWNAWQWLNAYAGFEGEPVAYHLWFLRDLFVLNLLAGQARKAMERWPRLVLAVLAVLYGAGVESPFFCLRTEALCFFCLGYYVVKYPVWRTWLKAVPAGWLWLAYGLAVLGAMAVQWLHGAAVVIGLCCWWRLASGLAEKKHGPWLPVLVRHGYGIYLFHEMGLTALKKLCVQMCPGLVWLVPAAVIAGCCAVCVLLEKHQSGVYGLLTGKTDRVKIHGEAA